MAVKNQQLADPALAPFLATSFDAAEYLNNTLPSLHISGNSTSSASLPSISAETQTLLASLNAQATRLTNTLTQMTDDILRSGSRLAYQVDVLRSESSTLSETMSERLQADIKVFSSASPDNAEAVTEAVLNDDAAFVPKLMPNEPAELSRLRLLVFVKDRLDSVIQVFGAATAWPAPPVSSSSFISVSAPPLSAGDRKAKEYAEMLRAEVAELLDSNDEAAAKVKVDEYRVLLDVWKGTAEEKGREKFVADLIRLVENRQAGRRALEDDDSQAYLTGIYT